MKTVIRQASEVKRFAVHDGDGIRTTVFLQGCPLSCKWCHNPEGKKNAPVLGYYQNKCINCGECVGVCENGAHRIINGKHEYDRSKCSGCGKCEDECLGSALTLYGKEVTADEVVEKILEDKAFYGEKGGATLSGGECLLYPDFCMEVAKKLLDSGVKTDVDTCGYVDRSALEKVLPYVDVFLYDVKAIDPDLHKKWCGVDNKIILENLVWLVDSGAKVEVRIPYIPEFNANETEKIAKFLQPLNILGVRILPFHNFAVSKYEAIGIKCEMPTVLPLDEEIKKVQSTFENLGIKVIK